jgi:hypothetical protein
MELSGIQINSWLARLLRKMVLGYSMDERDIWRTASLLISQFGDDAEFEAARRADQMLDTGDIDGQRIWRRVLAAVRELTATVPAGRVH